MQDDRALLEAAAKAAGVHANQWADVGVLLPGKGGFVQFAGMGVACLWNPLTDDGDALRLAVKRRMTVDVDHEAADGVSATVVLVYNGSTELTRAEELHGTSPDAATRRAIVRAAAALAPA